MSDGRDTLPPSVSVVMPTYNRRDRLAGWVDAVLADPTPVEVVVVVDGCDDGSIELLDELAATRPRLRPVRIDNTGQFGALQAGAEVATGEVLLLLDDDVVPTPGLVAGHAERHRGRDGLVVLGYMPVALPERRRAGDVATWLYAGDYEYQCRQYERDQGRVLLDFWAGNFSLRRADALAVGLSLPGDGAAFPYHPDRDFGLRCRAAGLVGEFDRSLRATHLHQRSFDSFLREARARAIGGWHLHQRHAAAIGAWSAAQYEVALPRPAALAVRAARRPWVALVLVPPLRAVVALAGAVRWWKLESLAAIVAMHVIQVATVAELHPEAVARGPSAATRRDGRSRGRDRLSRALALPPIRAMHERTVGAVRARDVVRTVALLDAAGAGAYVAGGWGVDALVGRQTRAHHDLDLVVDDRDRAVDALVAAGYRVVDEYVEEGAALAHRVIVTDGHGLVDLHPVDRGALERLAPGDVVLADGVIAGVTVPCLSAAAQLALHDGYEPRRVDGVDVAHLRGALTARRARTGA